MTTNLKYAQLQTFRLGGAGSIIGDTTLLLTLFNTIDGTPLTMSNFGTYGYGTIQANEKTYEEQIRFTGLTTNADGTVLLTGVSSLSFVYPYTVTPNITKLHPGGASFIISNTAGFYNRLVSKDNDEIILGIYTFTNPNVPRMDAEPSYLAGSELQLATKYYVDSVAIAGAPNASTTQKGIVEIGTDIENGAGTGTGGTGAILVAASSSHNYISAIDKIPVGRHADGYLDSSWGGTANSIATLNGSSKVVQNPASATVTPTINSIPLSDSVNGEINDGWIPFNFEYGDGSDGDATIAAGTTTLVKDTFYNNLTLQNGAILDPNGYYVFVKGTLTQQGTGKIARNGNNGSAGTNAVTLTAGLGGSAGAALSTNTLLGGNAGVAGGNGGTRVNGGNNIPGSNANASSINSGLGITGSNGGTGGKGGAAGAIVIGNGGTGTGGSITHKLTTRITDPAQARIMGMFQAGTFYSIGPNGQPGGGGGGSPGGEPTGGDAAGSGGGGGGSGSDGGAMVVFAKYIVLSGGGNLFEAKGGNAGNGGNGGNATAGNAGGGGPGAGGAGGGGGLIVVVYKTKSATITYSVTGGSIGTPGTGGIHSGTGADGAAATAATTGDTGFEFEIQMSA